MRVLSNSSPWGPRGRVKCDMCTQTVLSSEDSSEVLSVYLATGDQGRIGSYLASAEPGDRSDAVRTGDRGHRGGRGTHARGVRLRKGTRPQTVKNINIECMLSLRFVDCAIRLHTNEMYGAVPDQVERIKLIGYLIGSAPPTTSARHCNAVSRL